MQHKGTGLFNCGVMRRRPAAGQDMIVFVIVFVVG